MRRIRRALLLTLSGAALAVGLAGCVVAPAPGYYGRPYYHSYYGGGYYGGGYYAPRPYYRYW